MTSQLELLRRLGLTSGRRTYRGNKLVGGVANSDHLNGTAADFTADAATLRRQLGPNIRILDEGDHRHVSGLSDVPYYGSRGTAGLVNGVDTSAPKRTAMPKPNTIGALAQRQFDTPQPSLAMATPERLDASSTLGSLAGGDPQVNMPEKKGFLGLSKNQWAAILAATADSIRAANGQPSNALGSFMADQRAEEERGFEREKWDAMLSAKRQEALAKAAEPPQWLRDAQTFARLPQDQRQIVTSYRDAMYPVIADVQGADGSVVRQQMPRSVGPLPGDIEDGHVFLGGNPADPSSWRPM